MFKQITTIFLLFFSTSCATKIGNKATIKLYEAEISQGTKLEEIVKNYGQYSDSWNDKQGNKIYQYSYLKSNYDLISHLPIINHFGWITTRSAEVILIFDKNGGLIQKNGFIDKAKAKNSLVCNPRIYSCVRQVVSFEK